MVSKGAEGYPEPVSAAATAVMTRIPREDTKPEIQLRSALHRLGYRFRKNASVFAAGRRCRPDILMPKYRVAVFIDGCFWHFCAEHGKVIKGKNAGYWANKWKANTRRDQLDTEALQLAGWTVLRIWEHVPLQDAIQLITVAAASAQVQSGT